MSGERDPAKAMNGTALNNPPVLIVDPVALFREGLRHVLREANFQSAWCDEHPPSGPLASIRGAARPILIVGSPVDQALAVIADVKRHYPATRVALLFGPEAHMDVVAAFQGHVDTILPRESSCEVLIAALRLLLNGMTALPSALVAPIFGNPVTLPVAHAHDTVPTPYDDGPPSDSPGQMTNLSAREFTVLYHLMEGLQNKEIARRLNVAEATVKVHVKAILRKAHLSNRTQVALWASRQGLGRPTLDIPISNEHARPVVHCV